MLVDDDLVLTESLAIAQYIAHRYGGMLGPQTEAEVAQTQQWALFAATAVEAHALEIQYTLTDAAKSASAEGQAIVQIAAHKLRPPLARLQMHLAAQDWLVGDRFTVADICVAECLRYAQGHPTLLARVPGRESLAGAVPGPPGVPEDVASQDSRARVTGVAAGGFTPPTPRGIFVEADLQPGARDENTPREARPAAECPSPSRSSASPPVPCMVWPVSG